MLRSFVISFGIVGVTLAGSASRTMDAIKDVGIRPRPVATTFVEMFDISVEQPTMFVVPVTDDIMRVYLVDQAIAAPPFEEVESWEGFLSDWAVAVGEWTMAPERWMAKWTGTNDPVALDTLVGWGVFDPNLTTSGDERYIAAEVGKWRKMSHKPLNTGSSVHIGFSSLTGMTRNQLQLPKRMLERWRLLSAT